MVREKSNGGELFVSVPSYFRCPISMDLMKSPVSLSTGVTYDRSSIQTWLDSGHNTCPATMQVLPSTDFVPNLTLRRLIHLWSDSLPLPPSGPDSSAVSKQQLLQSVNNIGNKSRNLLISLSTIVVFAKFSDENREFLAKVDGFVAKIVDILSNVNNELEAFRSAINVLNLIISESGVKEQLHRLIFKSDHGDCLSAFVSILQKGPLNSRIESATVLATIAIDAESQRTITEKQGLLYELYRLVSSETDQTAIEAGLQALTAVSTSRPVKKELVRFGIVRTAAKIISDSNTANTAIEKAIELLEMVSTCTEGRAAISDDETCVAAIVQRLMKVSGPATEHGVTVLWSVCYLSRDPRAQEAVVRINGLTKVLLVMQSSCAPIVRQMCGDLVKVFRVNSRSCLASYETKTTHITPY